MNTSVGQLCAEMNDGSSLWFRVCGCSGPGLNFGYNTDPGSVLNFWLYLVDPSVTHVETSIKQFDIFIQSEFSGFFPYSMPCGKRHGGFVRGIYIYLDCPSILNDILYD